MTTQETPMKIQKSKLPIEKKKMFKCEILQSEMKLRMTINPGGNRTYTETFHSFEISPEEIYRRHKRMSKILLLIMKE